jgi:ACS family hexuronate transporter-like MFS transporter
VTAPGETEASERVRASAARRWTLCLLLFLATTLNYLDRQTMSILAPRIQREMGFDNEALGWLFSVFYYSYTFSQFGVGLLLDRYNLRWAYGLAVLAWSATAGLTGLARGFAGLLGFRLLLGVMESANWPAAMRMVARTLPPRDRTLGNGIFTSGTSIGALIAPALLLGIAGWAGWRWAFAAVGSLGAVWFAVWALFTRHEGFRPAWSGEDGRSVPPEGAYRRILGDPQFWRVFAVAVLVNPCLYFSVNWLPTYFVQERGVEGGGPLTVILTAIYLGLDLGYLACGAGVMLLSRAGWRLAAARRAVFLSASGLLALCAAVPFAPGIRAATVLLVAVNFGAGVWISMYLTMGQEISRANVSTAAGLLGGSGSLAGAVAMWAVGAVTRRTGSFSLPMAGVAAASLAAALAGLAASRNREQGAGCTSTAPTSPI